MTKEKKVHGNTGKRNAMIGNEPRSGRVHARVQPEVESALDAEARRLGITKSRLVAQIVEQWANARPAESVKVWSP